MLKKSQIPGKKEKKKEAKTKKEDSLQEKKE